MGKSSGYFNSLKLAMEMGKNMQYISNSESETYKIGKELGNNLKPNDIVALYGDLGAGKTALVRGVCSVFWY